MLRNELDELTVAGDHSLARLLPPQISYVAQDAFQFAIVATSESATAALRLLEEETGHWEIRAAERLIADRISFACSFDMQPDGQGSWPRFVARQKCCILERHLIAPRNQQQQQQHQALLAIGTEMVRDRSRLYDSSAVGDCVGASPSLGAICTNLASESRELRPAGDNGPASELDTNM